MPDQHELERNNDVRFLTPLLLMAAIIAGAVLVYAYAGGPLGSG